MRRPPFRVRRTVASSAALLLLSPLLVGAGQVEPAPIVIEGEGNSYVDVTLDRQVRLGEVRGITSGDASRLGSGGGDYRGYAIFPHGAELPVAGNVEVPAFEEIFGRRATFSLTSSRTEVDRLEPGRYRVVLLGEGATRVEIPTLGESTSLRLRATAPAEVTGGVIDVSSDGAGEIEHGVVPVTALPDHVFLRARTLRIEGTGAGVHGFCTRERNALSCSERLGSAATEVSGNIARAGSVLDNGAQVGSDPGLYDVEWRNGVQAEGPVPYRALVLLLGPGPMPRDTGRACPSGEVPQGTFSDVGSGPHAGNVDCLAWYGIGRGDGERFRPAEPVRRDQMASFVVRLLEQAGVALPDEDQAPFEDTDGNTHERAIAQLASLGVAEGSGGRFRPAEPVRRDQMTSFINRAHALADREQLPLGTRINEPDLRLKTDVNFFNDITGGPHVDNVDGLAQFGITTGTSAGRFEPGRSVTRGQMASFLVRELDLLTERGRSAPPSQLLPPGTPGT